MSPEEKDIRNLKEAIVGILELSIAIAPLLKDGIGLNDLGALWDIWKNDTNLKEKLIVAIEGYDQIPDEVSDLSIAEGMEVAMVLLPYVPKLIDAFKKED
ncbi:MAG: hypothetical protein IID18_00255 [Nitrospinae bacterium]|nr:hypothetical protein [Nitrospinota bacterium]